jgi:hypothetical protein
MATNYEALDAAIISALGERPRGFTELYSGDVGDIAEATCRNDGYRAIDRRLQTLRKRGLIRYAGCCWHLVATGGHR